jgi:hypothetical protein
LLVQFYKKWLSGYNISMFTLDRRSSKGSDKKSLSRPEIQVKKSLKELRVLRDINEIKNVELDQFMAKPLIKKKPMISSEQEKAPKTRLSEIESELVYLSSRFNTHIKNLKLKEEDLSVAEYSKFVRANKIILSPNSLFDRILYSSFGLAGDSANPEFKLIGGVSFLEGISNIVTYISTEIDPKSLYDFKVSVLDYLNFVSKKKLKEKNRTVIENRELQETNKNRVQEIRKTIELSSLESSISVEELMSYLAKEHLIPNQITYHHLLSQMNFIRKNLHTRTGTVKFINQAMFLVKSLPKTIDQHSLILGIGNYIESKEAEILWSDDDEWE